MASTAQTGTKRPRFLPKNTEQSPSLSSTAETALAAEGKLLKGFSGTQQIFWDSSSKNSAGNLLPWFLILLLSIPGGSRAWFPHWETMEETRVELAAAESREAKPDSPTALAGRILALILLSPEVHTKHLRARSSPAHPVCLFPSGGFPSVSQHLLLSPSWPGDAEPTTGINFFVQRCPGSQSSPDPGWQSNLQLLEGLGKVFQVPF